ncbi:homeobox protein cut-like 1 isoform X2 [Ictalurus furcatus]|uniref:homeobox protein cut-like 1 isoform X2 n=1 Tax=Ictalurus furcatus TaxID=66913 RepID=UPI0023504EA6|nr:homeobox protein cut-like 1 isoform X2 [Ictalurus furcatus]
MAAAARAGSMCQRWKRFDLQQLQKDLDVAANALASTQHENEQTRKKLIDQSDELKKHTPEDLHEHITPLLKGFQSEIDALCERSKESEAAFLSVYKRLIDVPDPVSALEVVQQLQIAVIKMRDVEAENQKLRERLQEYDREVAEVKGHEETIKALREKLESYEHLIQCGTKDEDEEEQRDADCAGKERLDENEAAMTDVETANQALEAELVMKQREVERLMENVQKLQSSLTELANSTANQIRELQQQLDSKHALLQELEEKLEAQADYEEIKRELRVLRSVELGSSERPAEQGSPTQQDASLSRQDDSGQDRDCVQKQPTNKDFTGSAESRLPAPPSTTPPQSDHTHSQTPPLSQILLKSKAPPESSRSFSSDLFRHRFSAAFPPLSGKSSVNSFLQRTFGQNSYSADLHTEEDVDTAEIARQVKEQLLKHNIGQRVFGHYVLGLSQGSVSEILARPKPWNKLTVRGKEPFHKMRHFLSDEQNILNLRSIQGRQRGNITSRVRVPESSSDESRRSFMDQTKRDLQGHKIEGVRSSLSVSSDDSLPSILDVQQAAPGPTMTSDLSNLGSKLLGSSISVLPYSPLEVNSAKNMSASPVMDSWREQWWSAIQCEQRKDTHSQEDTELGNMVSEIPFSTQDYWKDQPSTESPFPRSSEQNLQMSNANETPHSGPVLPSSSSSSSSLQTKQMKATMMPLTAEQYERFMYQEVDTVELTQQVKDKLAKNGICQRIFGEKVLGLSQGSVSDMLSRPKQWTKLTQKGREPFIRMQLWIEGELQDPMRETLASVSPAPESPESSSEELIKLVRDQQEEAEPESHDTAASMQDVLVTPPELDTYSISKRVREVLSDNNVGQRLFGEAVLGLTQGSVSDLLARPKPWHRLSVKGREPFVRMQRWLNDTNNIHKLREIKHTEKKVYLKRRVSSVCEDAVLDSGVCVGELGQEYVPQLKKSRVVLTAREKEALRKAYEEKPYPSPGTIEELSQQLGLKASTVTNWFHNYRSRIRRGVFMEAATVKSDGVSEEQMSGTQESGELPESTFNFSESSASPGILRDSSLRRRKAANLNSIIHRLEKAANRDEAHDGGDACESQDASVECVNASSSG